MRTPSEMLGLMAYLFVMYGGVPDRDLLSAAYNGDLEEEKVPKLSVIAGMGPSRAGRSSVNRSRAA